MTDTNRQVSDSMGRGLIRRYAKKSLALCAVGGVVLQLIPFGCGRGILNLVTPILLDDTIGPLDRIVRAVAPLVLP